MRVDRLFRDVEEGDAADPVCLNLSAERCSTGLTPPGQTFLNSLLQKGPDCVGLGLLVTLPQPP